MPPPVEQWTPGPAPAERVAPFEPPTPVQPARSATAAAGADWSIVSEQKGKGGAADYGDKKPAAGGDWQLASGEAPLDTAEDQGKRPAGQLVGIAQYAILVIGLVMVLIGVLVMVANSHPT
jgi:hypothetical protein